MSVDILTYVDICIPCIEKKYNIKVAKVLKVTQEEYYKLKHNYSRSINSNCKCEDELVLCVHKLKI